MKAFDFTYYRIAKFLKGKIRNWSNASIALVTLIQVSLVTYPSVTLYAFNDRLNFAAELSTYGLILCAIAYILNMIRYSDPGRYDIISIQYGLLKDGMKRLHGVITAIFVFISFFYAPIALVLAGAKLQ